MSEVVKTCIDRVLPPEEIVDAAERAIEENPRNAPADQLGLSRNELALVTGKMWENGRVLKVAFLDGHDEVQERVQPIAHQWSDYANITFDFGNHAEPDIRISFELVGSWAYLGTDAMGIDEEEATMNYGWLTPESTENQIRRVVLHEFGHALACIHEHQNPNVSIPWDKEKLYAFYAGEPNHWSKMMVDQNLLDRYDRESTAASEFDPDSIMLYPIPQEHTIGDYEVGWNTDLSEMDKRMIAKMYPKDA